MTDRILCLDTSVLIKYLTPEEQGEGATSLVLSALENGPRLIAPAWTWAEVGSVLRKKVRARLLRLDEAQGLWSAFLNLPIEFVEAPELRSRSWQLAEYYSLPTLYDAAFLACTEVAAAPESSLREFWTADRHLLKQLGAKRPAYARQLDQ